MTQTALRTAFYIVGVATSAAVIGAAIALMRTDISQEVGSLTFSFIWLLLPFAVLPWIGIPSTKRLTACVTTTVIFWVLVLAIAKRSQGDMNFGLAMVMFLSPLLIGLGTLAIERLSSQQPTQEPSSP